MKLGQAFSTWMSRSWECQCLRLPEKNMKYILSLWIELGLQLSLVCNIMDNTFNKISIIHWKKKRNYRDSKERGISIQYIQSHIPWVLIGTTVAWVTGKDVLSRAEIRAFTNLKFYANLACMCIMYGRSPYLSLESLKCPYNNNKI